MWECLEPLLPDRAPRRGGLWSDDGEVVEAIVWRFRTRSPSRDLPAGVAPWQTAWWRFDRWAKDGTFNRVLGEPQVFAHAADDLEWVASVDATIARAHQHAAGPSGSGGKVESQASAAPEPADHALGRSRGGWTTKAHTGCRGCGSYLWRCGSPPDQAWETTPGPGSLRRLKTA